MGLRKFALPAIVFAAFLIRFYAAFFSGLDPYVFDSKMYMMVARGILSGSPVHSFPNGYPLLIALLLIVTPQGMIEKALIGLNVLLSTAVVVLTYQLARRVTGNHRFALLISAAIALYPHQIHYTRLIMTEVLCTFLLTLAALLTLPLRPAPTRESDLSATSSPPESEDDWGLSRQLLAGVLYYYSAAVRPSVLLTGPIVILAGLFKRSTRREMAFVAMGFVATIVFFTVLEKADIVASPATYGNNLLISINSDSRNVEFREFPPEEQKGAVGTYVRFALAKPGPFLLQRAISFWELWGPISLPGGQGENRSLPVRFVVLTRTFLLALAVLAVWRYRRSFTIRTLFAPILGLTLISVATFSNHRFIAPVEPMLFVLAGIGLWQLIAARRPSFPKLDILS